MAIQTYADLQSAVADWTNRSDLTARIPDFITLAEARMMRKQRLRLFEVEVALSTVAGSRYVPLPADYREPINLWINWISGREALNYASPDLTETQVAQGRPFYWGIDAANIAFERPADQTYSLTFRYIQQLALSNAQQTNALLTAYPDAYLTAALAEACRYLKDPQGADLWDQKHNQISHDIREEEERSKALVTLHTDVALLTPRRFDINRGY